MRLVDDLLVDVKRSWRRAIYTSPAWRSALPESIVVTLPIDDSSLEQAEVLSRLGALLRWLGPITVTITGSLSKSSESAEWAISLVRFARRSGAHVRLVVGGALSLELSKRLVGVGLAEAVVCLGGLEENVHAQLVESELGDALDAVANLREARVGSEMTLVVAVVVSPDVASPQRAVIGWARQAHVDRVVFVPKRGTLVRTSVNLAGLSIDSVAPSLYPHNTGSSSTGGAHLAIKLAANGSLWISRDTMLAANEGGDLDYLWRQSLDDRKAIRDFELPFDEIDLDLWGR